MWVWLIDAVQPATVVARLAAVLDDEERVRAAAMRRDDDRRRFTVAHGALRLIVAEHRGVAPAAVTWRRGPHGKPETDGVHVNLSHSGELNAVALDDERSVGVDVQELMPATTANALARRYFPAAEVELVAAGRDGEEQAQRFARLWARKEACVKARGGTLASGLPVPVTDDVVAGAFRVADLDIGAGFRAAVALTGVEPYAVTRAHWQP